MVTRRRLLLGLAAVLPALPASAGVGAVARSPGWHAWIDLMPGRQPTLIVTGEVRAGHRRPTLSDTRLQGFNPAILMLDLKGAGRAGNAYRTVRFGRPARAGQYTEVDVFVGRAMIARIPVGATF
jgi:hypothetical protein